MDNKNLNIISKNESKVKKILVKVLMLSIAFLILLSGLIFTLKLVLNERTAVLLNIDSLDRQNRRIIDQVRSIEKKYTTATNYIKVWNEEFSEEQKLIKGINVVDIEKKLQELAKINNITSLYINYSPVILVGGIFEKNVIKTYTTLFNIKFSSVTDIDIFRFLDDINLNLGYFVIIQEITFQRVAKIDEEFLKILSENNIATAVNGEIKLRIYGLGLKEF